MASSGSDGGHPMHQSMHPSPMQMQPSQMMCQPNRGQLQMSHVGVPIPMESNVSMASSNAQNISHSLSISPGTRFQLAKSNQLQSVQPTSTFANIPIAQNRFTTTPMQVSQPARVVQQNMFQSQNCITQGQQPLTLLSSTDGQESQLNLLDQHRPVPPSYIQSGPAQVSKIPGGFPADSPTIFRRRYYGISQPVYCQNPRAPINQPQFIAVTTTTGALRIVSQPGISGNQPQQQQQPYVSDASQHQLQQLGKSMGPRLAQQVTHPSSLRSNQQVSLNQSPDHGLHPAQMKHMGQVGAPVRAASPGPQLQSAAGEDDRQAQVSISLKNLAQRYLPVLRKSIELSTIYPEMGKMRKKYEAIRDILTYPESRKINYSQLPKFEQILIQMKQDQLHLLQTPPSRPGESMATGAPLLSAGQIVSDNQKFRQKMIMQQRHDSQSGARMTGRLGDTASSSSLNSLLSQPVESSSGTQFPPHALGPSGPFRSGLPNSADALGVTPPHPSPLKHQVDRAGVQQSYSAGDALSANISQSVDFFEKLDLIALGFKDQLKKHRISSNSVKTSLDRASDEIFDDTRAFREASGHRLPLDIFPLKANDANLVIDDSLPPSSVPSFVFGGPEATSGPPVREVSEAPQETDLGGAGSRKRAWQHRDSGSKGDKNEVSARETPSGEYERDDDESNFDLNEAEEENIDVPFEYRLFSSTMDNKPSKDLSKSTSGGIKDLHPLVAREINNLRLDLGVVFEENSSPPSMAVMETHFTCRNKLEWNGSFHLKLTFDGGSTLPCSFPPLYVRLPPDYTISHCVNWYLDEKDLANTVNYRKTSLYSPEETRSFLSSVFTDAQQNLHTLRKLRLNQVNLTAVAKSWMNSIFASAARFMNAEVFVNP